VYLFSISYPIKRADSWLSFHSATGFKMRPHPCGGADIYRDKICLWCNFREQPDFGNAFR